MLSESHEEYLELCALSTSGDLTRDERSRLDAHLATCASCSEAKREYEMLAHSVLPGIASEQLADNPSSQAKESEDEFLRRLEADTKNREFAGQGTELSDPAPSLAALDSIWRGVWSLYAAGIILTIALGISAYQYGTHRAPPSSNAAAATDQKYLAARNEVTTLESRLSDTGRDLANARAELGERDKIISSLRTRFDAQSEDLSRLNSSLADLKRQSQSESSADAGIRQAQADSARKLEQAEAENQALHAQLEKLESQTANEKEEVVAMQAKVDELGDALKQKQGEVDQQTQLLAHDRDIRELMGARDLYMAEVYDVARSGETRKPYGRLFYTKEKSLVFYAYDLDQDASLRNVSTFQAWGRRGPDPDRALKLGIFYQDNAAKKRWVMKCNDAKTLSQIDAVFVTVEPSPQSSRPSSKSLLFAFLHVDPNHP